MRTETAQAESGARACVYLALLINHFRFMNLVCRDARAYALHSSYTLAAERLRKKLFYFVYFDAVSAALCRDYSHFSYFVSSALPFFNLSVFYLIFLFSARHVLATPAVPRSMGVSK